MARVESLVLAALAIVLLSFIAARIARQRELSPGTRVALGIATGLVGAFVVGVAQIDLIPDAVEDAAQPVVIGGITAALLLVSIDRARR